MIRNVVMGRVRDDLSDAERQAFEDGLAGVAGLDLPGQRAMAVGRDLGLRDGGWSFAITNDWDDADSYRNYDTDEEHNRYRAGIVAACETVARVQIQL